MRKDWSEVSDLLGGEEAAGLEAALKRYAVPPPSCMAREAAVEAALRAMDKKRGSAWQSLWAQVKVEARFIPAWYYLASLFVAAAGACLLLVDRQQAERLAILAGVVPLPALLGLLEVFHGMDEGMAEIECACRYSPARVLSARMLIIGALSCASSALLGLCSRFGSAWMAAGLVVIPYCLSVSSGLLLSAHLHGKASSAQVALAVAFANAAAAATAEYNAQFLEKAAPLCWAVLMALSLAVLLAVLRETLATTGKLYERKLLQWN